MSREIKFRGWDTKKKIMYSPEEMGRDQLTISTDGRGFVNVNSKSTKLSKFYGHIIPEQYIGIKDKDGKEIYAGDKIEWEWGTQCEKCGHKEKLQDEVKFGALGATVMGFRLLDPQYSDMLTTAKVIGTIHDKEQQ